MKAVEKGISISKVANLMKFQELTKKTKKL